MKLRLISLTGTKFDNEAYEVILPTKDGEIGVLERHMPLVSVADNGVVAVRKAKSDPDRDREYFAISGGVISVEDNELVVIVDEADHADNINEAEAQAAHERALKMQAEAKDQVSLDHAQALVDKAGARLKVADLKRRYRR